MPNQRSRAARKPSPTSSEDWNAVIPLIEADRARTPERITRYKVPVVDDPLASSLGELDFFQPDVGSGEDEEMEREEEEEEEVESWEEEEQIEEKSGGTQEEIVVAGAKRALNQSTSTNVSVRHRDTRPKITPPTEQRRFRALVTDTPPRPSAGFTPQEPPPSQIPRLIRTPPRRQEPPRFFSPMKKGRQSWRPLMSPVVQSPQQSFGQGLERTRQTHQSLAEVLAAAPQPALNARPGPSTSASRPIQPTSASRLPQPGPARSTHAQAVQPAQNDPFGPISTSSSRIPRQAEAGPSRQRPSHSKPYSKPADIAPTLSKPAKPPITYSSKWKGKQRADAPPQTFAPRTPRQSPQPPLVEETPIRNPQSPAPSPTPGQQASTPSMSRTPSPVDLYPQGLDTKAEGAHLVEQLRKQNKTFKQVLETKVPQALKEAQEVTEKHERRAVDAENKVFKAMTDHSAELLRSAESQARLLAQSQMLSTGNELRSQIGNKVRELGNEVRQTSEDGLKGLREEVRKAYSETSSQLAKEVKERYTEVVREEERRLAQERSNREAAEKATREQRTKEDREARERRVKEDKEARERMENAVANEIDDLRNQLQLNLVDLTTYETELLSKAQERDRLAKVYQDRLTTAAEALKAEQGARTRQRELIRLMQEQADAKEAADKAGMERERQRLVREREAKEAELKAERRANEQRVTTEKESREALEAAHKAELTAIQARKTAAEEELAVAKAKITQLESDKTAAATSFAELFGETEKAKKAIKDQLAVDHGLWTDQNAELERENAAAKAANEVREKEVEHLKADLDKLVKKNDEIITAFDQLQSSFKTQRDQAESRRSDEKRAWEEEKTALNDRNNAVKGERDAATARQLAVQQSIKDLQKGYNDVQASWKAEQDAADQRRRDEKKLWAQEKKALNDTITSLEQTAAASRAEKDELVKAKDALAESNRLYTKENDDLRDEATKIREYFDEFKKDIDKEKSTAADRTTKANDSIRALEQRNHILSDKNKTMEQANKELSTALDKLKNDNKELSSTVEGLKKSFNDSKAAMESERKEGKRVYDESLTVAKDNQVLLEKENNLLKQRVTSLDSTISDLTTAQTDSLKTLKQLNDGLAAAKKQLETERESWAKERTELTEKSNKADRLEARIKQIETSAVLKDQFIAQLQSSYPTIERSIVDNAATFTSQLDSIISNDPGSFTSALQAVIQAQPSAFPLTDVLAANQAVLTTLSSHITSTISTQLTSALPSELSAYLNDNPSAIDTLSSALASIFELLTTDSQLTATLSHLLTPNILSAVFRSKPWQRQKTSLSELIKNSDAFFDAHDELVEAVNNLKRAGRAGQAEDVSQSPGSPQIEQPVYDGTESMEEEMQGLDLASLDGNGLDLNDIPPGSNMDEPLASSDSPEPSAKKDKGKARGSPEMEVENEPEPEVEDDLYDQVQRFQVMERAERRENINLPGPSTHSRSRPPTPQIPATPTAASIPLPSTPFTSTPLPSTPLPSTSLPSTPLPSIPLPSTPSQLPPSQPTPAPSPSPTPSTSSTASRRSRGGHKKLSLRDKLEIAAEDSPGLLWFDNNPVWQSLKRKRASVAHRDPPEDMVFRPNEQQRAIYRECLRNPKAVMARFKAEKSWETREILWAWAIGSLINAVEDGKPEAEELYQLEKEMSKIFSSYASRRNNWGT